MVGSIRCGHAELRALKRSPHFSTYSLTAAKYCKINDLEVIYKFYLLLGFVGVYHEEVRTRDGPKITLVLVMILSY